MSIQEFDIHQFNDLNFLRLALLGHSIYSGREIADADYLSWEYARNPNGMAQVFIAEVSGSLAAQYIVIPVNFLIAGKEIIGSLSVNTLTHPAYKGNDLFPKLATETFKTCPDKGIHFTIGFPNPVSLPIIEKKKIFKIVGTLPLLIKPLNPFRAFFLSLFSFSKKSGKEIELEIEDDFLNENGISFFDFEADRTQYNKFISDFSASKENITIRSPEYLRWRYSSIPIRKYRLLKICKEDKIMALAIFRAKYIYGIRCGILVDFISLPEEDHAFRLLHSIKQIARKNSLDILIATLPDHVPEFKFFIRSGYFSLPQKLLPQKLTMIVKAHTNDCPAEVSDFKKWFITFGDYDIF